MFTKKKAFLSLFLSFMLVIGVLPVGAAGTEVTVNSLSALRTELGSATEKTIVISGNIAINSGYMLEIPSGAKITLRADAPHTITASGSNFRYGAIQVKKGAQLIIGENITFTNSSGYFMSVLGTLMMNSGSFTGNKGSDGGAINVGSGGLFTMNGGMASGNSGVNGGAVHVVNGGSFVMNGGSLSNNTASVLGGALLVNGSFVMNGGAISGNTAADQGGGIYIDTKGKTVLYAGDLYNNTATSRYGGAIGTGTTPQAAGNLIYNAVIVGNRADKNDGRGGGVWSCPSGIVSIAENSTVIAGNSAAKRGAQVCIESTKSTTIPMKTFAGADYNWKWDMEGKRYPGVNVNFENGVTPPDYDRSGITLANTVQITAANLDALKAEFPAGKVFIYNNSAGCGGGVGGNGSISFAKSDDSIFKPRELGWMRSSELEGAKFLKLIGSGDAWTYGEVFSNTPIKYFESEEVRAVANAKAIAGTEYTTPVAEQLVGLPHIWDGGNYFNKYKEENGNAPYDWASWNHWGVSGNVEDKGEYSIRRFSAYVEYTQEQLDAVKSVLLAPNDELGNMSYLFPINDNVFVFVNGVLAYWGGTDVIEGQNQYGALNRTEFMGKKGIPVRNGVNGVFKNIYPHTDGWCIDLEANKEQVNIKSLLNPGFNRIDIITDEYWEGGGMNRVRLYNELASK